MRITGKKVKVNVIAITKSLFPAIIWLSLVLAAPQGCADTPGRGNERGDGRGEARQAEAEPAPPARVSGRITAPADGNAFAIGDIITIDVEFDDDAGEAEEISITADGLDVRFEGNLPGPFTVNTGELPAGTRQIRVNTVFDDGRREAMQLRVVLRSDIVPVRYTYRIVNSYPHDIRAFTQGLVYYDGYLYESTGQYGQSTLRKVDLETGEVLRSLNLDRQFFGEGLTVYDGKLYQLTWQSRVGFVYDIGTFRVLNRVHYETEGWGLTTDGSDLLKSDGSHYIYKLDPQYFSENGRIEVYDRNGRVDGLNELQYVDGIIYANVFGTDEIVMIEHGTGRVTGVIDLTGLLDRRYHHPNLDVLNGIAWDADKERLLVTGKNWPRLFEIELVER